MDLPESIKVHPVFNADKLRKVDVNPLPGQEFEEPPPIEVDGEHEWELERILGVRLVNGGLKYRVQWTGFDEDIQEYWAKNFRNSPQALKDFHDEHPNLPGPPLNLDYWLQCAKDDVEPKGRPGDDDAVEAVIGRRSRRRTRATS